MAEKKAIGRRQFLEKSSLIAAASAASARAASAQINNSAALSVKPVRLGFIGVGIRGTLLMEAAAGIAGVEIKAAADCYKGHLQAAQELITPPPATTGDYKELIARPDIDAVVIVVSVMTPPLHPKLIDRYLIAVQRGGAEPMLCVNKIDLLETEAQRSAELEKLRPYQELGLQTLLCSSEDGRGIDDLRAALANRRCVFVGHSGVGKSSLTNIVAERFQARRVMEVVEENPFLASFYTDRNKYAFQTQMFFLLSRFKQQQDIVQQELFQRLVISDYTFQKDRIFAYLTLGDDELALYDKLYATLEPSVPVPDLVLYLTADVDTCMARIRRRGRGFEKEISEEYMAELIDAYNHYFHYYNRSPLLVVDTRNLNLVGRGNNFDDLVDQLKREIRGTEYFATATKG